MRHGLNIVSVLGASKWQHWSGAGMWFLFTVIGGLMPVWAGLVVFRMYSQEHRWLDLLAHGELAVYSAAFLAPSVYIIVKDLNESPFVHRPVFSLLAVPSLLLSAIVFAVITANNSFSVPVVALDQAFVLRISFWLFLFSSALAFLVYLVDSLMTSPDVRAIIATKRTRLDQEFEKSREE